jgi:predicted XRE-type DNA-binding protein
MKSKTINGVAVEYSNGNVFADLGLPDADKLKVKSGPAAEIIRSIRRPELSQTEAGERMGISRAKVSNLLRGNFTNLSERKMMECLNQLGCDIEIVIKPAASGKGQLRLARA